MESFSINPSATTLLFNSTNLKIKDSYPINFSFNKFKFKSKSSVKSLSSQPPSSPLNLKSRFYPSFVAPVLQSIKGLALSQSLKWTSLFRAYSADTGKFVANYNGNYLQNGGLGVALLSVTASAKVHISPFVATLAANPTFVSALIAWFIAQSMKVFLNFFVEKKWDFRILYSSGGMPSSHSALCTALTTSVALCHGVADSLFPVCLGFSLIVMYDAIGVRRHAGMQAAVLNMIVEDLFQGHPISQRKLKELLGHTPSQVAAGAILGILVAWVCCQGSMVAT